MLIMFNLRPSLCRLRGTAFQVSIRVAQTRAVTRSCSAVMATGTAPGGEMRRTARCVSRESIPARVAVERVTRLLRGVITRRSAPMAQMRKTALTASLETSTVEPTCASLRRGAAMGRRTVSTAVMKETVLPPCPGRWSQRLWLAAWSVGCYWSLHWVVPLNSTRSGQESTGEVTSIFFLHLNSKQSDLGNI